MAEKRNVWRVVVGSPLDVRAEREAVHRVCAELNRTAARDRGLMLEVGAWDTDAYPGFHPEGPQGLIDACLRIEDCDVFIGVFWKRFGTPVPDAGSGTEHEIRKAYAAWQEKGRPQLMVYFNEASYFPQSSEEAKQQLKVLEFREAFPKEGSMHEGGRDGAAVPESRVRAALKDALPSQEALDRFIQAVRDCGSLFEERAELFQFTHLSFQEFLAARSLAKRRGESFAPLAQRLADPWWREVILLTHGFAQADYRPFAGELLEWLSSRPEGDAETHLAGLELAGAALLELERPDPEQRRRQAERLAEAFRAPAAPVLLRARSGVTLAQLGDPRGKVRDPDEMQFCFVPSGEFWFGIAFDFEKEGRAQRYKLDYGYWMARFPVTNAQFERFVKDGGYATGRFWPEAQAAGVWSEEGIQGRYASSPRKGPLDLGTPLGLANHPIVGVKWYEALAYIRWLTERWQGKFIAPDQEVALPSEPEWEKAARRGLEIFPPGSEHGWPRPAKSGLPTLDVSKDQLAPNEQPQHCYPWGPDPDPNKANYADTGIGTTSAVGIFPGGASTYGCEEMSGNVWEWTRSLSGDHPYPESPGHLKKREASNASRDQNRVLRGGGFHNYARFVRCASRLRRYPDLHHRYIGFRVVVRPLL